MDPNANNMMMNDQKPSVKGEDPQESGMPHHASPYMELAGGQIVTLKQQLKTFWQEQMEEVGRLGTGNQKKGTLILLCGD